MRLLVQVALASPSCASLGAAALQSCRSLLAGSCQHQQGLKLSQPQHPSNAGQLHSAQLWFQIPAQL